MVATTPIGRSISMISMPVGLGVVVQAAIDQFRACGCGQALDACQSGHCPRCGVRLVAPRRTAASSR